MESPELIPIFITQVFILFKIALVHFELGLLILTWLEVQILKGKAHFIRRRLKLHKLLDG